MDVTLVLCDYADAVNGKLYITGAGWTDILASVPAPVALGLIMRVPWDQSNKPHHLVVSLVDEDGREVKVGAPEQFVRQEGTFEVGRPPGTTPGSPLPLTVAMRWSVLPLAPGSYSFTASVDGEEAARVAFRARAHFDGTPLVQ